MAKQTFTTGQVLTAAQMTSLQQTAMGGGSATAKTASYVLVAADAGTTVAMNAAGATTITVNTGLFAAGDTVFIQNLGAGACTVTAGTATVATAGSLILPQNDAGILYFTATGASIFYDYIQAGAVSPLTTKGDLYTFSTSDARLAVGANNTTLVADSAEATGLKWATPATGGMTLIETLTLSGASTTSSTIPGTYKHLQLVFRQALPATDGAYLQLRFNGDSGTKYRVSGTKEQLDFAFNATQIDVGNARDNTVSNSSEIITVYDYTNTLWKNLISTGIVNNPSTTANYNGYSSYGGQIGITSAITSVTVLFSSGNITSGTCLIYGVS